MTTELELQTTSHMLTSLEAEGQLVLLVDSFNQESLNSFELGKGLVNHQHVKTKGAKQEDPSRACSTTACRPTREQMQLDQAKLQGGQLRQDLSKQLRKKQEDKNQTIGDNNNSLGSAWNSSSLGNNSLGIEEQQECRESLEQQPLAFKRSSLQLWKILIDTGAELSVAPWDFAAEIQLSPL